MPSRICAGLSAAIARQDGADLGGVLTPAGDVHGQGDKAPVPFFAHEGLLVGGLMAMQAFLPGLDA